MDRKNAEGYYDPTAWAALSAIEREERQAKKLKKTIYHMCELAGFQLKGQIILSEIGLLAKNFSKVGRLKPLCRKALRIFRPLSHLFFLFNARKNVKIINK